MPGATFLWTEAAQEAATLAPSDDIILHTLELRHPSLTNADGRPGAIRCVMDHGVLLQKGVPPAPDIYGHYLTLEADAPLDPGQAVAFVACMFDMALGPQETNPPTIDISLDNVTQLISPSLDAAVSTGQAINVTYREYLLSMPLAPQFKLPDGVLQRVVSTLTRVTGTVIFNDLLNKNFPSLIYRPADFPGLVY